MSTSGERAAFTRPDGTIVASEMLWRNATAAAVRLGNVAAEANFKLLAHRASLKDSSQRYDFQRNFFNPVTSRVSRAVDLINGEIASPRKTNLERIGDGSRLLSFHHSVDGTSLIESNHQPMLETNAHLGVPMEQRLRTGEGLRIKPDPYWKAIFDSVTILMTNGNPDWQEEELPDLVTEKERLAMKRRVDFEHQKYRSPTVNEDLLRQVITDQAHLDHLAQYDRIRKLLTVRQTSTPFGVTLVHLAEKKPKYPPHVQQFLIAQKVERT